MSKSGAIEDRLNSRHVPGRLELHLNRGAPEHPAEGLSWTFHIPKRVVMRRFLLHPTLDGVLPSVRPDEDFFLAGPPVTGFREASPAGYNRQLSETGSGLRGQHSSVLRSVRHPRTRAREDVFRLPG